jgi:hypothetical protein
VIMYGRFWVITEAIAPTTSLSVQGAMNVTDGTNSSLLLGESAGTNYIGSGNAGFTANAPLIMALQVVRCRDCSLLSDAESCPSDRCARCGGFAVEGVGSDAF